MGGFEYTYSNNGLSGITTTSSFIQGYGDGVGMITSGYNDFTLEDELNAYLFLSSSLSTQNSRIVLKEVFENEFEFRDERVGASKTGFRYTGFGETDIDTPGSVDYSTLVFNSLVPKKYVDDEITSATSTDVPMDSVYTSLGAGTTFDLSTRKIFKRTVDANVTTFGFTGGEEDKTYKIYLKVDATGGYSFDYDYGNIETQDGIELILPSDPSSKHLFQVEVLDNGRYLVYPIYNIERITRNTELTAGLGIQSATATGINPLISNSNAAGLATVTATATGNDSTTTIT
jgi:hypothetical protein